MVRPTPSSAVTHEATLAQRIQAARDAGDAAEADRLCWELVQTVGPVLRAQVRRLGVARRAGQEVADLLQIARLGAFRAAQRFDGSRGVPFAAYARWWVWSALVAATANHHSPLRVPRDDQRRLPGLQAALQAGVTTPDALADQLGLPPDRVGDLLALVHDPGIPDTSPEGVDAVHPEAMLLRAEEQAAAAARWAHLSPALIARAVLSPDAGEEAWRLLQLTTPDVLLNDPAALALLRRVAQTPESP